jgi:hypothetical protein
MHDELERRISHIEGLTVLHLSSLAEMLKADGGKMFPLDMLAAAAVKRSMSLCAGFSALVRDKNYTCAASLLRLQLDSCLRFFAAFIVEKPHDFALAVFQGNPIRKMKDRDGNFMTDRYLVDMLGKKYEWMPRVYDATSGFIHLSERHIFTVFQAKEGKGNVALSVGAKDDDIPVKLWVELTDGFLASTDALFEYLKGWTFTKQNPGAVEKHVEEQFERSDTSVTK